MKPGDFLIQKYNPYHAANGQFTTSGNAHYVNISIKRQNSGRQINVGDMLMREYKAKQSNNLTHGAKIDNLSPSASSHNTKTGDSKMSIFSRLPENTSLKKEFTEQELESFVSEYKNKRDLNRNDALNLVSQTEKKKGFNAEQKSDLRALLESEYSAHAEKKSLEKQKTQADLKQSALSALDRIASKKQKVIDEKYAGDVEAYKASRIKFAETDSGAKWNNGKLEGTDKQIKNFLNFLEN